MACGIPRLKSVGGGFFKQKCRKRCIDWALFGGDTKGKRIGFCGAAYTKERDPGEHTQRRLDNRFNSNVCVICGTLKWGFNDLN
jgi:hypothetical protein